MTANSMNTNKPKVLIVDDEKGLRIGAQRLLELEGYEVTTAENGTEGINSNERSTNLVLAYTYYPSIPVRITTSVKMGLPGNDFGVNAQGSTAFNISLTYYISDLK